MVAHVVHVVAHGLAVLHALEDAADVRLALRARAERGGVGQERLQEFDRHDLLSLEVDGVDARHAHVLQTLQVREVALAEGHEEADALDALQVAAERLQLLVMEEVHVFLANLVEVVHTLDRHRRGLHPPTLVERLLVLHGDFRLVRRRIGHPVAAFRGHLADVDLGIEVGGEGIAVVAAVAVKDVERVDLVEVVLLGVGGEHLRHAGVEPAAEDGRKAGLLEPLAVGPLPGILEVRLLGRLVVRRVEIAHPCGEAGVHDREILVRQRDVHHEIGLVLLDERGKSRHVHRVDLRRGDFRGRALRGVPWTCLDIRLDGLAPRLGAGGDQQFAEHVGVLGHLRGRHASHAAGANQHYSAHGEDPFSRILFMSTRIPCSTRSSSRAGKVYQIGTRVPSSAFVFLGRWIPATPTTWQAP